MKPGVPGLATFGTAAIGQILAELAPAALALGALIEAFSVEVINMCPSDPPPMPTWDAQDAITFALGNLSPYKAQTDKKIGDLLYNWAWNLYCECVDGFVPPAPTPPLPPPGAGGGGGSPVRPCFMGGWAGNAPLGNGEPAPTNTGLDVGMRLLPSNGTTRLFTSGGGNYKAYKSQAGVTRAEWTRKTAKGVKPDTSVGPNILIQEWTDTNTLVRTHDMGWTPQTPVDSGSWTVGTNTTWMTAYAGAQPIFGAIDNIADALVTVNIEWFCGSTGDTLSSCCPPDPSISLALNNIFQIVQNTQNQLTGLTNGWVDGTRHSNLSDTGSFMLVDDAKAVRVETHQPLPPLETLPGTPIFYWDMGFLTPYILQSPLRSTRVTFNPQTIVLPQLTDQVGYTLYHDVVIDIVELVPAPE